MARLTFAVEEPEPDVLEVVEPLVRLPAWAVAAPAAAGHRPITAPRGPDCGPVRSVEGYAIHRVRVVNPEEKTCLVCGETTMSDRCPTCGKGFDDAATPMVPTVSYLQPGEYEFIQRSY